MSSNLAKPIPFVPVPGRQVTPHAAEARRTLRNARVHLGRCASKVQYVLAMLEVGVEPTAEDLANLAHDIRFVSSSLTAAHVEVDHIIAATTPVSHDSRALRAKVLPRAPHGGANMGIRPAAGKKSESFDIPRTDQPPPAKAVVR